MNKGDISKQTLDEKETYFLCCVFPTCETEVGLRHEIKSEMANTQICQIFLVSVTLKRKATFAF